MFPGFWPRTIGAQSRCFRGQRVFSYCLSSCLWRPRPHRRCWTAGVDLGERWSSWLVATASEDGLNIQGLSARPFRHQFPCASYGPPCRAVSARSALPHGAKAALNPSAAVTSSRREAAILIASAERAAEQIVIEEWPSIANRWNCAGYACGKPQTTVPSICRASSAHRLPDRPVISDKFFYGIEPNCNGGDFRDAREAAEQIAEATGAEVDESLMRAKEDAEALVRHAGAIE
jgi:hypothetical protein